MLGWQIAVLVVMIVVFLLGATVLSFLLYRYGKWGFRGRWSNSDCPAVLHFLDLDNKPRSVDLAEHSEITSASSLFSYIADLCGLEGSSLLSLHPLDSDNGSNFPIALDIFLKRDQTFIQRIQQTMRLPLVLKYGWSLSLASGQGPSLTGPDAEYDAAAKHRNRAREISISRPDVLSIKPAEFPSGELAPIVSSKSRRVSPPTASHFIPTLAAERHDGPTDNTIPLVPIILPGRHHIDTATPIMIQASRYFLKYPNGNSQLLDYHATAALNKVVFDGGKDAYTVVSPAQGPLAHAHFFVYSSNGTILLRANGAEDCLVVHESVDPVLYTIDRSTNSQWRTYKGAFFLPPGRWCVRARAGESGADGIASRVYAVEMALS